MQRLDIEKMIESHNTQIKELTAEVGRLKAEVIYEQERNINNVNGWSLRYDEICTKLAKAVEGLKHISINAKDWVTIKHANELLAEIGRRDETSL